MKDKKSLFLYLIPLLILSCVVQQFVFYFFKIKTESFYYSPEILYVLFSTASIIVILIVLKIKEKNFDSVGMAFLVITSVKMVFSYVILRPILSKTMAPNGIEKTNFFVMFVVFLAIETVVTIRILNEKHKNTN